MVRPIFAWLLLGFFVSFLIAPSATGRVVGGLIKDGITGFAQAYEAR